MTRCLRWRASGKAPWARFGDTVRSRTKNFMRRALRQRGSLVFDLNV
jgi:hypothetical protein